MKDISCNIIEDLIPLVKDGIASDESMEIVKEHIRSCDLCKMCLEESHIENYTIPKVEDKEILALIKRRVFMVQIVILMMGAIIGVALTNSMGMFYNFMIMPIMGALSFIALKQRWYIGTLAVMILAYLWQIVDFIISEEFIWEMLYGALFISIIYGGLVVLGVIIALLLRFAFGKDR
ncbi:zf-HC2 domain-containing protein [Wansuia hejianensis]|uniref:Zf-HC2 domain-containing protein n=1 Tax=Wansuia hejianensis TaxID=2763667 RepID=A0A926EYN9_9FIRM|nr:zf-HC2 domain-containing protein [Wansuia hejianensis]MBC8590915.1 zf-HC2 domain-containing protein [Wansuia hejianensis]